MVWFHSLITKKNNQESIWCSLHLEIVKLSEREKHMEDSDRLLKEFKNF